MSIIGISGKLQSGKNTVANIIQYLVDKNKLGYTTKDTKEDLDSYLENKHYLRCNWQQKAFAAKLKDIVCILLGCTREQLEDREFKEMELGEEWDRYYICSNLNSKTTAEKTSLFFSSMQEAKNHIQSVYEEQLKAKEEMAFCIPSILTIKKEQTTVRQLLQTLGTDLLRNQLHPNVWCNALFSEYSTKIDEDFLNMSVEKAKKLGLLKESA